MSEYTSANDYIKRLQRLIDSEATFTFSNYIIIKASLVDDMLACVLAAFPDFYKKALLKKNNSLYSSVIAYNTLVKILKRKFFLLPNYCIVDSVEANKAIGAIVISLEKDMLDIENQEMHY